VQFSSRFRSIVSSIVLHLVSPSHLFSHVDIVSPDLPGLVHDFNHEVVCECQIVEGAGAPPLLT
jgi:hypothetical protein